MSTVYLDHNATTALDSRVLEAMLPWMTNQIGNPTSRHVYGRSARSAIEHARTQVAEACGAFPSQVIFTSSGTEANNLAIKGLAVHAPAAQILYSAIEHPCVSRSAHALASAGFTSKAIAVDSQGNVNHDALQERLTTPTHLVSVMLANNESGVLQPIAEIAELVKRAGALMHTDAVQGLGKLPLRFNELNVHAMAVSSHKIHGPQGVAALIVDKRVDIGPLLHGGGQEKGLRSGTENIAAIVGFGAACELTVSNLNQFQRHTAALREQFEQGVNALGATVFSQHTARIANTSFFALEGIEGETLVIALDRKGFAVASGSACSSDSTEPSHVLLAMGVPPDLARGAVRISFGINNTEAQVNDLLHALKNEIARLKQLTGMAA